MDLYGNVLWNNATSNSQKSVMTVDEKQLDNVIKTLDEAGMNYCYYIKDNVANIAYAKVAVNNSDLTVLRKNPELSNIEISKPIKSYTPSSSIIGRIPYREIRNRSYQKLETDLALKVAEELEKRNIPFSGRIYGDNTTITIDKANRSELEKVIKSVVQTRQSYKRKIDNIDKIYSKLAELTPEKQEILMPLAELCFNKGEEFSDVCLQNFENFASCNKSQLAELSKIIIDTYSNLDDKHYILANTKALDEFQTRIEKEKLFEELIYLKGFNAEQKNSLKQLIELDVPESVLQLIDYDFTPDDMLKIPEILKSNNIMEKLEKYIANVKGYSYISVSRQIKNNTYVPDNARFERYKYLPEDYTVNKFKTGSLFKIPVAADKGLWNRLADYGITPKSEDEDKIILETNGKEWNKIVIPDRFGNMTNSIDISEILTSEEQQIVENIINDVQKIDNEKTLSETVQNQSDIQEITSDEPTGNLADNVNVKKAVNDFINNAVEIVKNIPDEDNTISNQETAVNKPTGNVDIYSILATHITVPLKKMPDDKSSKFISHNIQPVFDAHEQDLRNYFIKYSDEYGFVMSADTNKVKEAIIKVYGNITPQELVDKLNAEHYELLIDEIQQEQVDKPETTVLAENFDIESKNIETVDKTEKALEVEQVVKDEPETTVDDFDYDADKFFFNEYGIEEIYYNPDSTEGGQFVISQLSYNDVLEAARESSDPEHFFMQLEASANQTAIDVTNENFSSYIDRFNEPCDLEGGTYETMNSLIERAAKRLNKTNEIKNETTEVNEKSSVSEQSITVGNSIEYDDKIWTIEKIDEDNNRIVLERETGNIIIPHESMDLFLSDVINSLSKSQNISDTVTEKTFAEQVDDVLSGKASRYNDLKVCDTPQILLDVGCQQLPMLYTQKHLKNALHEKSIKNPHWHGLISEQIKLLPKLLSDPVMVFDSLSRNDSIILVLDAKDNDNLPILVSVKPNGNGKYELEQVDSNFITSVYGKDNFTAHIKRVLENDKLLYASKQKSQDLFRVPELQLLWGVNKLSFDIIIHQSRNIVNENSVKKTAEKPDKVKAFEENKPTETSEQITFETVRPDEKTTNANEQEENNVKQKNLAEFIDVNAADKKVNSVVSLKNYRITDDNIGAGTQGQRFQNNIAAIKLLKQLEVENRQADSDEQAVLAKYVGWGGLAEYFKETNPHYQELKDLLTENEYSSARSTTLDSFYTSPVIIDSIYSVIEKSGFKGGNILEPAMGVGNFFGKMPDKIQENSKLYGVEIDSLTGRIAKQLYPQANIAIKGFEKTNFKNDSFDVAVGNIPFGDFSVSDKEYDRYKLKIHDYFFLKTLDKVKDGGIVAFVTSKGTLDKKDNSFRKLLSDKADLLGAVRLPNDAFKTAGTEVTSDIIFLQKRQIPPEKTPDWVNIGKNDSGFEINQYFIEHPEMVLGEIVQGNKMFGRNDDTMCVPLENSDLSKLLPEAVSKINVQFAANENSIEPIENSTVQVPDGLRNYSFFEFKDNIYTAYDGNIKCLDEEWKKSYTPKNIQRAKDYIAVRDTVRELLKVQQENTPETELKIKTLQSQLNTQYDNFYKQYGLMHSKFNNQLFHNDSSYPLMLSLEDKVDKDKLVRKSDIFFKRTIRIPQVIDKVDTAQEALSLSIAEKGKVDIDYMSALTDLSPKAVISDLKGEIYPVPELSMNGSIGYQTASEYLSGDIYSKLHTAKVAAENNDIFRDNIAALEAVIPTPLTAGDIDVECGAMWIPTEIYQQFMYETFKTPDDFRADRSSRYAWQQKYKKNIEVEYSPYTGKWNISNKTFDRSVTVQKTYGAANKNAYSIFESVLNLHTPNITKTIENPDNPSETITVQDIEATKLVKKKAETIKKEFKDWIFKDPDRRKMLVDMYNEQFNCIRPREYDGSAMTFPGMSASIELHDHQKNAIAHAIHGGNTLFAHCVGAGKTFEMIATAMESKRLGLCSKSLFAVPNHLTEQVGADFMKLYPSANILVATKKDFEKKNRSQLLSKIATGNYDAVIIGHSQLSMIPISPERQERIYKAQIADIAQGIAQLKIEKGEGFQVKQMERTRKNLEKKIEALLNTKKDNTVYFEELGIDKMFVDEAHEFKNLMSVTKLQNVSGISGVCSQKATDLFMKCRYLDEKTGGKGVVFATGTPVSNSITELHTMMRYLQYDFLCQHNMQNFDNWVSTFGKQKTEYELAPTGDKFKARTRIASYANMPELMSMFKQCADVRTSDSLKLPVPECEMHIVNTEPTPLQQNMVQELSARADDVQKGSVDPHTDNMLKITSDGRKVGLDPRLVNPDLEDNPNTKLNQCVNNVFRIYKETEADKLTQIIFCDLGVPKKDTSLQENIEEQSMAETDSLEESGTFCVYDDIKQKLISMGVAPSEIAFIHSAKTEAQKSELFDKVRSGEVRVLLGSTAKMGTGTNVQDRLIALHDLDVPWRPADLEQRRGRMVRQGNINKKVHLYRYVTKGTFDAYSYQLLETKQRFISQIITSKTPARTCSDVDQEALTYSEIKALCTGDQRIKEKLTLDNRVKELKLFKKEYDNTHYELEDKVSAYPNVREKMTDNIDKLQKDFDKCKQIPFGEDGKPVFSIKINKTVYNDRKEAAEAFKSACDIVYKDRDKLFDIGEIYGFKICATYDHINECTRCIVKGESEYSTGLGTLPSANINKVEKLVIDIEKRLNEAKNKLVQADVDIKSAKEILSQPFEFAQELSDKTDRLEELTDALNAEAAKRMQSAEKPQRTHYFGKNKILPPKNHKALEIQDKEKSKCRNEVNEI